jgi:flap endonuclease-1
MIVESKKLLSLMGVPAIQAPSEGEAQAALLAQRGEAYACASQDYDTLLFGAPILVRNLTITGKRKLPNKDIYVDISTELIDLQRNLELLKIDRRKLIWIGILVGTDFNEGVKGIGPKKALKLVSNCNSLEEVIKESNGIFESDPREIEKIFLEPDIEKNYSIEFGIPDKHSTIDFLCGEHSFSKERFEKTLDSLISVLSEKTEQSKLESWFK